MSKVKSFRLNEYEENLLENCTMKGFTSHQTVVNALEYYLDNVVSKVQDFDLILNFNEMPEGINNPMVDTFVKQVCQGTNFKFAMFLDGDCIGLKLKEDMLK